MLLKNISLTISIPAYNEEKNIKEVVEKAVKVVAKLIKDYEIVLVDDGSTDRTGKIIDLISQRNRHIKVIHHEKNKGFTGAMRSCLYTARKDLVFLAPADRQFDFSQLPKFIEAIGSYDMAVGYKKNSKESIYRKFSSWAFYALYQRLFNVPLREISTVFMWKRKVIESIEIKSNDNGAMFLYEFFYKAIQNKFSYIEIPIDWKMRLHGKAKGRGIRNLLITLVDMFKLRLISSFNYD